MAIGTPSSTAPLTSKVNTGITSCPDLRELTRTSTVWQNGQQRKKQFKSKGESTAPSSSYVPPTGGFLGIGRTQPSAEFGVGEVLVMYVRRDMEVSKKGGVEIAGTVMDESVIGDDGVIGR